MTDAIERSAEWVYQGVWLVLTDCFQVPKSPPSLPVEPSGFYRSFHPSRKYLSYLKFYFWIALVVVDLAILVGWVVLLVLVPILAWILLVPALLIAIVPDIVAYVMIHLRYDTMWYVITDRSLRARRGIWVILEHTITFENVQNVSIQRGPVQYLFGISTIVLETAGAGEGDENPFAVGNKAIMQGIDNPQEIKQLIMERVRATKSVGLGDEKPVGGKPIWSRRHMQVLGEIRDRLRKMA